MSLYVYYEIDTGRIARSCNDRLPHNDLHQELQVAIDHLEPGRYYVRDGLLVESPDWASRVIKRLEADVVFATQNRLDEWARLRGYDSILSACTYATSSVGKFALEGQYAVDRRDATWATLYAFVDDVKAGRKPLPTGFADVEPLLPVLEWPV